MKGNLTPRSCLPCRRILSMTTCHFFLTCYLMISIKNHLYWICIYCILVPINKCITTHGSVSYLIAILPWFWISIPDKYLRLFILETNLTSTAGLLGLSQLQLTVSVLLTCFSHHQWWCLTLCSCLSTPCHTVPYFRCCPSSAKAWDLWEVSWMNEKG